MYLSHIVGERLIDSLKVAIHNIYDDGVRLATQKLVEHIVKENSRTIIVDELN